MSTHVVVAGGGITGLAAALDLVEAGVEVTLVEVSDRLGGMLRTSPFAGRMVDEGADAFLVRNPAAVELARRVDLTGDLVSPVARHAHIWHDGALRPLPPQVMGVPVDLDALAASGLLSPGGMDQVRRDLTAPASPPPPGDVTIAEAISGRLGTEIVDHLVDPLLGGINAGSTRRQSVAAVAPQLDAARRDPNHASLIEACRAQLARARAGAAPDAPTFATPTGGMARLPARVAEAARATGRLEVRLGVGATLLEPGPVLVLTDGSRLRADAAVVATPAPAAATVLAELAPEAATVLGAIEHTSVAIVRLAVNPDALDRHLDGSGMLVPRRAGRTVTACSWSSSKWAHLAPERGDGTEILRAAVGRDDDQGPLLLDDDALTGVVLDDLTALLGLQGDPTEITIHRWHRAFPQYPPGHLDRIARAEVALAGAAPTVALAGMYLRGVGVPASVASGQAAAARVLAAVAP